MRSPEVAALLIAVMLKRSGQKRARISNKTLRLIAQRKNLRGALVTVIIDILQRDMGICMTELDAGGYGLLYARSLEAARSLTVKKFLPEGVHRKELHHDNVDELWDEISSEDDTLDDEIEEDDDEKRFLL